MKRPFFTFVILALSIYETIYAFTSLLDIDRRRLTMEMVGPAWGQIDFAMSLFLALFSVALIIGYSAAQEWAWKGTFYYAGLVMLGQIIGAVYGILHAEKVMEIASILRYGEVRPAPTSAETFIVIIVVVTLLHAVIAFFALRSVYKNKEYFMH